MTIETKSVASVSELRDLFFAFAADTQYVFRGHSDASWRLQSTMVRWSPGVSQGDGTYRELLSRYFFLLSSIGKLPTGLSLWGKLEFARHYGVPSPLIDFSVSPWVALFFAFNGLKARDQQAAVYCVNTVQVVEAYARIKGAFDPQRFQTISNRNNNIPCEIFPADALKLIWRPSSWNARMIQQMGMFFYDTVDYRSLGHQDLEDFLQKYEEIPSKDIQIGLNNVVTKVVISGTLAPEVFRELYFMGINGARLFDSHDGAAFDIVNSFWFVPPYSHADDIINELYSN